MYDIFINSRYPDTILYAKIQSFPYAQRGLEGKILLLETSEEQPDLSTTESGEDLKGGSL